MNKSVFSERQKLIFTYIIQFTSAFKVLHWLVFTAVQTGITPLTSTSQALKGRSIRAE
jgi:hypothetical protein